MFGLLRKKDVIKVGQRFTFTGKLFEGDQFILKEYQGRKVSLFCVEKDRNFVSLVNVVNPKNIDADEWHASPEDT